MALPRSAVDLRALHEVETPEQVTLRYEVAGLGSRAMASVIDHLLILTAWAGLNVLDDYLPIGGTVLAVLSFLLFWGYFTGFEAWWQGRTPGKKRLGIRVVLTDGRPVGLEGAALRNLVRVVDLLVPPPYISGMLSIFFHPQSKRLGDLVAGTLVVRDAPDQVPLPAPVSKGLASAGVTPALTARLTPEEYELLDSFLARIATLDQSAADRLAVRFATRFADRFPERPRKTLEFLTSLHAEERARRAEGLGGTGREIAALRLAARQEEAWARFDLLARRAAERGLDTFSAAELPEFAARYREIAADLARLRTYDAPAPLLARIERLVAAGHNALYRHGERPWQRVGPLFLREIPGALVRSWRIIGISVLLLIGTAVAGYRTLRTTPAIAEEVIPPVMLERAAAAAKRTAAGLTYVELDASDGPRMATALMMNNISVAFKCFAGGILLGFGSLFLLATNGFTLGAEFGHFVNQGAGWYLGSFVLGHGVLELFAICVAAAAGFRLGRGFWAPGDLSRGEALVQEGRIALRMVGACTLFLIIAGTIEGMASATGAGLPYRAGIALASAVFLVLYLLNGARWASTRDVP